MGPLGASPYYTGKEDGFQCFSDFFPVLLKSLFQPREGPSQFSQNPALTLQSVVGGKGDGRILGIQGNQLLLAQLFHISFSVEGEDSHFTGTHRFPVQPLDKDNISVLVGGLHAVTVDPKAAMGMFGNPLGGDFHPGGVIGIP